MDGIIWQASVAPGRRVACAAVVTRNLMATIATFADAIAPPVNVRIVSHIVSGVVM